MLKMVVRARPSSTKAHSAGIFATFEIDLVDTEGDVVVATLSDGTLRRGDKGYWITGPSKQVGEKWYKHWRLYPQSDRDAQNRCENWILTEISKQIPDPTVPVDNPGKPAAATNAHPFRENGGGYGGSQVSTKEPEKKAPAKSGTLMSSTEAANFPFKP